MERDLQVKVSEQVEAKVAVAAEGAWEETGQVQVLAGIVYVPHVEPSLHMEEEYHAAILHVLDVVQI